MSFVLKVEMKMIKTTVVMVSNLENNGQISFFTE
jgi:hypothetical protein